MMLLPPMHEKSEGSTCIRGTSGATAAPKTFSMTSCTSRWICTLGLVPAGWLLVKVAELGADDAWALLRADDRVGVSFDSAF